MKAINAIYLHLFITRQNSAFNAIFFQTLGQLHINSNSTLIVNNNQFHVKNTNSNYQIHILGSNSFTLLIGLWHVDYIQVSIEPDSVGTSNKI